MIVTVDLETYYSSEYSLSRMTEIDYILDPRFEFICCSAKVDNHPVQRAWGQAAIEALLRPLPWDRLAMLAHNNRFDGAILAWRLGLVPKLYLDTLSMARALTHAKIGRSSLAAVSDYLGLPPKGDEVVHARGKRLADFTPQEAERYMGYCDRDTDNCKAIFDTMRPSMPTSELAVIDWNLRMFIQPQVGLNSDMLAQHLHQVRADKEAAFGRLAHIDRAVFSSNQKFAALLEGMGVDVPTKISPTTGKLMPALAKNDVAFKELAADESLSTEAQAAIAIRLSAKSTIEETRTEKILNLALREWGGERRGIAPVPLKYYAAHTGRFGGDGGFNWQNFQRGSMVRQAVEAPPGYVIIHRDASQIEARMNAFLAGCERLLHAFERGEDIYSQFASIFYGMQVTKEDKLRRFVGKTSILGLGYGMGAPRFKVTLFLGQGGVSVRVTDDEARSIVQTYRKTYQEIPYLWDRAEGMLFRMVGKSIAYDGSETSRRLMERMTLPGVQEIPAIEFTANEIWLPNGLFIPYPNLRIEPADPSTGEGGGFVYNGPRGENDMRHLFGGKVVENLCQALSRIVITDIARRVKSEAGIWPWLTTHDSLDYCVPHQNAAEFDAYLDRQFAMRPSWAPTLPLASEGGWGFTLAAAEKARNPAWTHSMTSAA